MDHLIKTITYRQMLPDVQLREGSIQWDDLIDRDVDYHIGRALMDELRALGSQGLVIGPLLTDRRRDHIYDTDVFSAKVYLFPLEGAYSDTWREFTRLTRGGK